MDDYSLILISAAYKRLCPAGRGYDPEGNGKFDHTFLQRSLTSDKVIIGSTQLSMKFSLLTYMKMPKVFGIFILAEKFSCLARFSK